MLQGSRPRRHEPGAAADCSPGLYPKAHDPRAGGRGPGWKKRNPGRTARCARGFRGSAVLFAIGYGALGLAAGPAGDGGP